MPDDRPAMTDPRDETLARALAGLKPAAAGVDLPALMYYAGRASRDETVARWRRAFLVAVAGLGATWVTVFAYPDVLFAPRPVPVAAPRFAPGDMPAADPNLEKIGRAIVGDRRPEYVEPVPPPAPVPPAPSIGDAPTSEMAKYLRLRDAVVRTGLAGLPAAPPPAASEFGRSPHVSPDVLASPYRGSPTDSE